jgi:hypothetical protein
MAVRASTPVNLVIGAGDILVDQAHRGATAGDNSYAIVQEYFVPDDLNGVKGELLGTRYKTKENATLETMLPELAEDVIALLWPGVAASDVGSDRVLRSDATRRIATADYHDYELRVPRLAGGHFGFHAENALHTGNAEFAAKDKGMAEPKLSVQSTWDPNDLSRSPHFIVIASSGS